jgi:hypothetical protein
MEWNLSTTQLAQFVVTVLAVGGYGVVTYWGGKKADHKSMNRMILLLRSVEQKDLLFHLKETGGGKRWD